MCTHLDHRADDVRTPQQFVTAAREHLADCPTATERAWDRTVLQDGRRVLVELAGLPLELREKAWRELTGTEQRRIREAAERARLIAVAMQGGGHV